MGDLTEITVIMGPDDWRAMAKNAKQKAVEMVACGDSADRIIKCAELLRAADTFISRAELGEMLGRDPDTATIAAWDLTDEGFPGEIVPAA